MSGIVGVINFDGRPIDPALIETLTAHMRPWAPDASACVVAGSAGFGFAQLATTEESAAERQPLSFDGNVHLVADARIDDRERLFDDLASCGRRVARDAPDVDLVLHAYLAWGRRCVDRLIGDFAFAVWDVERGELLCARDHFGVKPFYYADLGDAFVFSNALNVVRMHPRVGETLDELAIADFLLFGFNQSLDTTSFESIRRIPPGHVLRRARHEPVSIERYWSLPCDEAIRYRRESDYVEHFRSLLETAVGDRLRGTRVAVSMSGGLDSTSVACMAHQRLERAHRPFDLRLCTNVYDRLIPDDERDYASEVARALNAPIHFESMDDAELHAGWDRPGIALPEPVESFDAQGENGGHFDFLGGCRVVLGGLGGDPLLASPRAYVLERLLASEWSELAAGVRVCLRTHGRLPSLGLRSLLTGRLRGARDRPAMPGWLNRELVTRLDLEARWRRVTAPAPDRHPVRPEAHRALGDATWQHCFGVFDPGCNGIAVEHRHPFFDVRLVRFALAMPNQPWFVGKALLREAMKGMLPESVRSRPKTVLRGDPAHAVAEEFDRRCRDRLLSAPGLERFVDVQAVPVHLWDKAALASLEYYGNIRAFSLGYWLNHCWRSASFGPASGSS